MAIKILVAEDHDDMRNHICELFENDGNYVMISQVTDGITAVEMAKNQNPDVILMDISMPQLNGMAATHLIKEFDSNIKIIALSVHREMNFVTGMFKAGASGYILKDSINRLLKPAVLLINQGQIVISKEIEQLIFKDYLEKIKNQENRTESYLSESDMEILEKLKQGQSLKDISEEVNINLKTIEIIYQKILQTWIIFIKSLGSQNNKQL